MIIRRIFAGLTFALVTVGASANYGAEPVWPLTGTDADVQAMPTSAQNRRGSGDENIRIVSKIGADLSVENNINVGSDTAGSSFSGGANLTQPYYAPRGFNPYVNQAEMAFMLSEMPETDGAAVLSVSKSNRKPILEQRRAGTVS